jgi:hypothetical protein
MASTQPATRQHSAVGRFFRNPDTGELAIVQVPNLPLAIFLVATAVRMLFHPSGSVATGVSVIAGVSLLWWAIDEVIRGNSPFRRVLGAAVLVGSVLSFLMR